MARKDTAAALPGAVDSRMAATPGLFSFLSRWLRRVAHRGPALIGRGVRPTFADRFRLLALQVEQLTAREQLNTLIVMSAYPREGRTIAVANLGIALAERGKRVVMVQADGSNDLVRWFATQTDASTPPRPADDGETIASGISGLAIAAPGVDSHLSWEKLIGRHAATADIVLIDAPACLASAEAFSLAKNGAGVLYVVRRRPQNVPAQREILAQLDRLQARVLGVIYNEA